MKRLSDRVIYDIFVPDVENVKDVFISKFPNSIEIKAFGKKKAYFKVIPYDMTVKRYGLKDGKLIVEFIEQ